MCISSIPVVVDCTRKQLHSFLSATVLHVIWSFHVAISSSPKRAVIIEPVPAGWINTITTKTKRACFESIINPQPVYRSAGGSVGGVRLLTLDNDCDVLCVELSKLSQNEGGSTLQQDIVLRAIVQGLPAESQLALFGETFDVSILDDFNASVLSNSLLFELHENIMSAVLPAKGTHQSFDLILVFPPVLQDPSQGINFDVTIRFEWPMSKALPRSIPVFGMVHNHALQSHHNKEENRLQVFTNHSFLIDIASFFDLSVFQRDVNAGGKSRDIWERAAQVYQLSGWDLDNDQASSHLNRLTRCCVWGYFNDNEAIISLPIGITMPQGIRTSQAIIRDNMVTRVINVIDDSSGSQGQKRGRAHEHDECENVEEESPKVHKGSTSSGVLEQDLDLDLNESGDETNA